MYCVWKIEYGSLATIYVITDFIGKFKDNSSNGYSWILIATDYFTKWVESIPTKAATEKVVMDFLEDKIITRFGVPAKITTDNAKAFS